MRKFGWREIGWNRDFWAKWAFLPPPCHIAAPAHSLPLHCRPCPPESDFLLTVYPALLIDVALSYRIWKIPWISLWMWKIRSSIFHPQPQPIWASGSHLQIFFWCHLHWGNIPNKARTTTESKDVIKRKKGMKIEQVMQGYNIVTDEGAEALHTRVVMK